MKSDQKSQLPLLVVALLGTVALASYFKYSGKGSEVAQTPMAQTKVTVMAQQPSTAPLPQPVEPTAKNTHQAPSDQPVASLSPTSPESNVTEEQILEKLREQLPQFTFSSATRSSVDGLYQVESDGQILYVNESADYILDGSLIRIEDRTNLTDVALGRLHIGMIQDIEEKNMLIYEPEQPTDRSITVFTDISCGYCRLLHEEMDQILDAGLKVRYLLFPRAGLGSQAHKDLESVWCADNPQEAMTNAKAGGVIEPSSCDNPIEAHVALANRLGLRGTPLIYTDSGEKLTGYREANILAEHVLGSESLITKN